MEGATLRAHLVGRAQGADALARSEVTSLVAAARRSGRMGAGLGGGGWAAPTTAPHPERIAPLGAAGSCSTSPAGSLATSISTTGDRGAADGVGAPRGMQVLTTAPPSHRCGRRGVGALLHPRGRHLPPVGPHDLDSEQERSRTDMELAKLHVTISRELPGEQHLPCESPNTQQYDRTIGRRRT